jgi:hypothetical protein
MLLAAGRPALWPTLQMFADGESGGFGEEVGAASCDAGERVQSHPAPIGSPTTTTTMTGLHGRAATISSLT